MAPLAWPLLWRGLTTCEALQAEKQLLDLGVGEGRWQRSDSRAIGADDDRVHSVSVRGAGTETLVMVHGLGTGSGIFFRNLGPLASSGAWGAVHTVDWRGAGLSGRPAYPARTHDDAVDWLVEGLEAWRREQNIETMTLLGHSMGGIAAAHYAARHGDRVDRLVLVGPAGVEQRRRLYEKGDSALYDLASRLWEDGYHPAAVVRALGPWGKRLVENYAARRFRCVVPLSDDEAAALGEYLHACNSLPGSSEKCMNQLLGPIAQPRQPIAPLVEDLACPVSFIYGEHDWMQPASGANVARRRLAAGKAASCVVVPGSAGHYVFLEDPAAFLDALLRRVGR